MEIAPGQRRQTAIVSTLPTEATSVPKSSPSNTLTSVLIMLRVPAWIGACSVLLRTTVDPDLWGHLRFGLDVLASRHLSLTDQYSYTSDLPWVNHEWLSELIMGAAFRAFGPAGLIAIKVAVTLAIIGSLLPVLRRAPEVWRGPPAFLR